MMALLAVDEQFAPLETDGDLAMAFLPLENMAKRCFDARGLRA